MAVLTQELVHRPSAGPMARLWGLVGVLCAALAFALVPSTATAAAAPVQVRADAVRGGDTLYSSGGRCAVAFNVTDDRARYGLMAGHCGTVGTQWFRDPGLTVPVGTTSTAGPPAYSWLLVRYTNTDLDYPSEINGADGPVRISGAAEPSVGQSACRFGSTTGLHCGTVTGVNQTVRLPEGTVYGLFRASICAEAGDAGGPAFAGNTALGILVAGTGNCSLGGTTYYQPVVPVLATYDLRVGY